MRERSPLVTELSPPCAADHSVTCTRLHPLLTVCESGPMCREADPWVPLPEESRLSDEAPGSPVRLGRLSMSEDINLKQVSACGTRNGFVCAGMCG